MKKITVRKAGPLRLTSSAAAAYGLSAPGCGGVVVVAASAR
jgi:hypothetical protein